MPSRSLRQLIEMVARRRYVHVGPPDAVANYVHVDDVVSALLACGETPDAAGQVFNVASDCLWTELLAETARLAEVPVPRFRLPARPLRVLARLGQMTGGPLSVARVDALCNRTRYATGHIVERLGFVVRRPLPRAVADIMGAHARTSR
jgi:nucleoside-diphosphate-sugar epimerase